MSATSIVVLIVGAVSLILGANCLVSGASSIATRFGLAPVVIGLTVVAFGTSAPELAVSVSGALSGNADVALGNVVGSNTFNILLILGLSAAVSGLSITQRLLKFDIPLLIVVSVLVYLLALNNLIGRLEGLLLLAGIFAYVAWLVRGATKDRNRTVDAEHDEAVGAIEQRVAARPLAFQVGLVIVGLVILVIGSQMMVGAATDIASALGVSDLVIGLTVVAGGTSLPELATSVTAAIKGQRDIAVGNVVGSNIFNLLAVLGASAVVSTNGIAVKDEVIRLDFPVTLAAAVVLLPICWNGFMIKRWEGAILVVSYVAYLTYLVLEAGDQGAPDFYRAVLLICVPLVLLIYVAAGIWGWRAQRASQSSR